MAEIPGGQVAFLPTPVFTFKQWGVKDFGIGLRGDGVLVIAGGGVGLAVQLDLDGLQQIAEMAAALASDQRAAAAAAARDLDKLIAEMAAAKGGHHAS